MSIIELIRDVRRVTILALVEATARPAVIGWVALFVVIVQVGGAFTLARNLRSFLPGTGIQPLQPIIYQGFMTLIIGIALQAYPESTRSLLLTLPVRGFTLALAKFLAFWLRVAVVSLIDLAVVTGFNAFIAAAPLLPRSARPYGGGLSFFPVAAVISAAYLLLFVRMRPAFSADRKLAPTAAIAVLSNLAQLAGLIAAIVGWYALASRVGLSVPLASLSALGLLLLLAGVFWERAAEDVPQPTSTVSIGSLPIASPTGSPVWELFRIQSRAGMLRGMMFVLLAVFEAVTLLTALTSGGREQAAWLFFPLGQLPLVAVMLGITGSLEEGQWRTNHLLLSLPVRGGAVVGARFLTLWAYLSTFVLGVVGIALVVLIMQMPSSLTPTNVATVGCGISQGLLLLPPAMLLSALGFFAVMVWQACRSWSPLVRLTLILAIVFVVAISGLSPLGIGLTMPGFECARESAAHLAMPILPTTVAALIALPLLFWISSVLWERAVEA